MTKVRGELERLSVRRYNTPYSKLTKEQQAKVLLKATKRLVGIKNRGEINGYSDM